VGRQVFGGGMLFGGGMVDTKWFGKTRSLSENRDSKGPLEHGQRQGIQGSSIQEFRIQGLRDLRKPLPNEPSLKFPIPQSVQFFCTPQGPK